MKLKTNKKGVKYHCTCCGRRMILNFNESPIIDKNGDNDE